MSNDKVSLKLDPREIKGKKVAKLRKEGQIPGVVYGHGFESISVQAPRIELEKVVRQAGSHHPVHLNIDGKRKIAMIKNIEINPAKNSLSHVSFHAVKQNEKVDAEIPIKLTGEGESAAEKSGLIVLQTLENLKVKALPMDLPDSLEVDISGLAEPNEHVSVSDIKIPEGVEIDDESKEVVVASVWEPSALQAANEAAGGDAEPGDESEVESEEGEAEGESDSQEAQDKEGSQSSDGEKKDGEGKSQDQNSDKK